MGCISLRRSAEMLLLMSWLLRFSLDAEAQHCQDVSTKYKEAMVFIKVERHKTKNGAPDDLEGSGFICDKRGFFVTNDHVVAQSEELKIDKTTIWIGSRYNTPSQSEVRVVDEDPKHDLALVQILNDVPTYKTVPIGESSAVQTGSNICSVGFPLGGDHHYSHGTVGNESGYQDHLWWTSDMPANRGESGAPVFSDTTGEVVGVKVAGIPDADNYNFIIPIDFATNLLQEGCPNSRPRIGRGGAESEAASTHAGASCQDTARGYGDSIVRIVAEKADDSGPPIPFEGTGFIVDPKGFVITTDHLVEDTNDLKLKGLKGTVGRSGETSVELIIIDRDPKNDLALLKIKGTREDFRPVTIGNASDLSLGSGLCSLGFGLGQGATSSTGVFGGAAEVNQWWSSTIPAIAGEAGSPVFDEKTGAVVAVKMASHQESAERTLLIPISLSQRLLGGLPIPSSTPGNH